MDNPERQSLAARADTLLHLNRHQDAVLILTQMISQEPEVAEHRAQLARALLNLNDLEGARQTCQAAIALEPEYAGAFYLLSYIEHYRHNFDAELRAAEEAVRLMPEEPAFLTRLGRAQIQSGMPRKAYTAASQALALDPESVELHELLGDVCLELERYQQAETHYREALKQQADDIGLINDLARAQMGRKNWRDAIDTLYQAIVLDPGNTTVQDNLYIAVEHHLDSKAFSIQQKKALTDLQPVIQKFYHERRARRAWLQKPYVIAGAWILGVFVLVLLFAVLTR